MVTKSNKDSAHHTANGRKNKETSNRNSSEIAVLEFDEIQDRSRIVRNYQVPAGKHLYAYRSDGETYHIVVSRGPDPRTRWEAREPARRSSPVLDLKRWTIPDNWEHKVNFKRNDKTYGLYYLKTQRTWVLVLFPTDRQLIDAQYEVKAVGDLNPDPEGKIGSAAEIHRFASTYSATDSEVPSVLHKVAENRDALAEKVFKTAEAICISSISDLSSNGSPVRTNQDWVIEFQEYPSDMAANVIHKVVDLSEYEVDPEYIYSRLESENLLPNLVRFSLSFTDSNIE